jgi:hypothetical protein
MRPKHVAAIGLAIIQVVSTDFVLIIAHGERQLAYTVNAPANTCT